MTPDSAEVSAASVTWMNAEPDTLMERVLAPANLKRAYQRVVSNKGAPGADGMTVADLAGYVKQYWPILKVRLLAGEYHPQAVRAVEIPKPQGGMRQLGIPSVVDRLIQQALLQQLTPIFDPLFSDYSYGFRPGRSAHQAVEMARTHVAAGHRCCVELDLEKFFDRVNHDVLIDRCQKRIDDPGMIRLIRTFLNSGIMHNGVVAERERGTPQGGPLSPLLANMLLDEVDRELERRGHRFARYADDCNIYVRSRKAGERVMALLKRLYDKLRLTINVSKSAVASAFGRKFLGYELWQGPRDEIKRAVSYKAQATFKQRIRELTRRTCGRSMAELIEPLRRYMLGWKAYFGLAQTPGVWRRLDEWIRHRLRAIQLKHWKRGKTMYRQLLALGASAKVARLVAANSRRWWHNSRLALNNVLTIAYFDRLGVPRLS